MNTINGAPHALFLVWLSALVLLPGCWPFGESKGKHSGLVVINVLEKELHRDCHIKGSINIPIDEIDSCEHKVEKDAEIIVHCSNYMCTASEFARDRLKKLGFTNVRAYEAGTAEWYALGLPVEGPCQEKYLNMQMPTPEGYVAHAGVIETEELARKMGVSQ